MSRRTGQLIALFSVIVLIIAVTGYQYFSKNLLKSDVLQTGYEGAPTAVVVAPAGITVVPVSGLTTTESGGTAGFTVALNTMPTADVSLILSSGNPGEGTVSPTSLTFTSTNGTTPQSVTVTGVDDAIVDGNIVYSIVLAPAISADPSYSGLDAADVSVTNNDNEVAPPSPVPVTAGITVTPTTGLTTTEAGGTAQFTVVLNTVPTGDVTIALHSSNGNEGTISPTDLTFTPANALTPQTVTVTGVDDAVVDGDVAYMVMLAAAVSTDTSYNGVDPVDVSVSNTDNDTAAPVPAPAPAPSPEPTPTVTPAVCGNHVVDSGEQCDDGNTVDGDGCSATCQTEVAPTPAPVLPESLKENPPQSKRDEAGITVLQYLVQTGDRAVLDAVQFPDVTSASTRVRWTSTNPAIAVDDPTSARTFFIPAQEGDFSFTLELRRDDGSYHSLPVRFDFSAVSPLAYSADANHDGKYDFNDLLNLLQNWDHYGDQATTILSVILSRYQGE